MSRATANTSSRRMLVLHLGAFRAARQITLEQICASTKISRRFLEAIEDEAFDKLPGGVFDINYLRQYASAVGYEDEKLLALYWSRQESATVSPEPSARSGFWSFSW